jgi:outer membrane protein
MSLIPAKLYFKPWVLLLTTSLSWTARAQETPPDSLLETATLENVVQYALEHQPTVQQALIDQEIANQIIKGKLADWYPQINFGLYYNRYFDLQSSVIGGNVIRFGVDNTSAAQFTATQNVFNRDVLLASSTASKVRILSEENITDSKIDVVVNVTKAFYDILATQQQVKVTEESLVRIEQSA